MIGPFPGVEDAWEMCSRSHAKITESTPNYLLHFCYHVACCDTAKRLSTLLPSTKINLVNIVLHECRHNYSHRMTDFSFSSQRSLTPYLDFGGERKREEGGGRKEERKGKGERERNGGKEGEWEG